MLQRKKERKKERKKGRKKGRKMSGNNSNAARSAGYGGSFFFARARYRHLHRNGFESPAPQNHFLKTKIKSENKYLKKKKAHETNRRNDKQTKKNREGAQAKSNRFVERTFELKRVFVSK